MPKNSEKREILLLYSAKLEGNGVTKRHTCCALAFERLAACLRRRVKGPGNRRPETRVNNKEYNKAIR